MKKLLLFALGAMMSMSSFAQEEDVTHYIQNAGFDQDLTFQANGAMKEIISTTTSLSDRSWAYIAADSSVYAKPKETSSQQRKDGRSKLDATNGFIGRLNGWQIETNQTFPKCEWVYFGTIPYALDPAAVPIADDGDTYLLVPNKPDADNGDDNLGFVYMRAGWGGRAVYKQTVKLPCAKYRLEYWAININPSGTNGKNLSKVTCRKETWEDETGFSDSQWTKHEIEFTPTAEFSMQFGFESSGGSGSNPFLCLDGMKLYKIGEANRVELLSSDLNDAAVTCSELAPSAVAQGFDGLASSLEDYSMEIEDLISEDADQMEEDLKTVNAQIARFNQALAEMKNINAILAKMDNLLQTTNYAGKAELDAAYKKILDYKEGNIDDDADIVALLLGAVAEAKEAIKAYYLSQADSATVQNPADFTFFIQHPWFINEDAEPTLEDGEWVFPKRYNEETGEDLYVEGSASSPDLNSGGWEITGTYTNTDQQRLNWQRQRSCWNAWGGAITGTIAVGQTIENLPNGYYIVGADLVCQSEYVNDQHVYAQSTADKKISADNIAMHEIDYDNNIWASLSMTAEEKVIVVDGKLTIGAEGTGNGSNQTGWFLATNFKLYFLGKASDADIAAAVKASFDAKVLEAKDLAAKMMLKGDQKSLNDSIAKYEGAADKDAYLVSIEALNAAIAEAEKSEAKYYDYLPTVETLDEHPEYYDTKTLLFVKKMIDGEEVEGKDPLTVDTKPLAEFAYNYVNAWLKSDSAVYAKFDATVDLLKNYVNTYIPAYNEAAAVAAAAKETGKAMLTQLLTGQKAVLLSAIQTKEVVDKFVAEMKEVMEVVEKQNIYEDTNNSDYTAFIQNPNAEATTGWDITMGNGDGNGQKNGQWLDGSSTRYFDSYHSSDVTDPETGEVISHVGLEGFSFSQLIKDLPNGTYKVGAFVRTPAEGAYLFAFAGKDTTFVEIPLDHYTYLNEETGMDTTIVASDKYGPLWESARIAVEELGNYTDEEYNIYNANGGIGRGWKHMDIPSIEVTNHELLIGSQCGNPASSAGKTFTGGWYSVGGWTLTLLSMGNNDGWNGPVSGINNVKSEQKPDGIYTIAGLKTQKLQRGLNIIVRNGNVRKVIVK